MKDIQKSEYDICSLFVLIIPGVLVVFYLCSVWGEQNVNLTATAGLIERVFIS